MVLPIFFIFIFGTLEFGLAFRSYLTLTNTTRDAARFEASLGRDSDADFQTINEIVSNMTGLHAGSLQTVIIFKATGPRSTTASGALNACRTSSVAGLCNRFTGSDFTSPSSSFGCGYTSPDRYWCPTTRKENVADPPDYVGVYVKTLHNGITGAFGRTRTFEDEVIMRIEPVRS